MKKLFLAFGVMSVLVLAFASSAFAAPNLNCTGVVVGGTYNDVTVPDNQACQLNGTIVENNAKAKHNSYLEINGGSVGHDVTGDNSTTVYLHDGVTVANNVNTKKTQQALLFDSSAKGINVNDTPKTFGQVNVCGMSVSADLVVQNSGSDILVGDPLTVDCAGNSVGDDLKVLKNQTDVELIVRGNSVNHDIQVNDNKGPSDKAVESNTAGHKIDCHGNQAPFTASANTAPEKKNQCSGP